MEGMSYWNGIDVDDRHGHLTGRTSHPNESKSKAELVARCRRETMKDGICPYEATCQAREACAESRAAEKQPSEKETAGRALCARVCVLANRMVKEISKKEAFAKAWAIARNGGLEISVAGVSYGSRQEALARLAAYDPKDVIALLVPEPDNPRDPDAIAVKVMVNNGKGIYTLGYVPRSETAVARAFLGRVPEIALVGGETKGARIRLAA